METTIDGDLHSASSLIAPLTSSASNPISTGLDPPEEWEQTFRIGKENLGGWGCGKWNENKLTIPQKMSFPNVFKEKKWLTIENCDTCPTWIVP